jgi:hypothetical protein
MPVLPDVLLRCGGDAPGSLVRPVAGSVHEDLVAGVDEPVEQGLGDDRVGEQRVPVNWNWLRFLIGVLPFDLLVLVFGVSA